MRSISGQNPITGLSEVYAFSRERAAKRTLHMTANGTLLTVLGGSILCSTDKGSSWSSVSPITGSSSLSIFEY